MARALRHLLFASLLGLCACEGGTIVGVEGSTSGGTLGSETTSGTTGLGDGSICSPCSTDTDCNDEGLAICEPQTRGGGACLPFCTSDLDCDLAAHCAELNQTMVCVPNSGTCVGFVAEGPRDGGSELGASSSTDTGSSGSIGSDSTGSTSASSSGASTSTTGSNSASTGSTGGRSSNSGSTASSTGTTGSTTGGSSGSTGSGVGFHGGTVNRMHFLITGDTRPPQCGDTSHYPSAIIKGIADAATAHNAQFAIDMGDHMFVCDGSTSAANAQMAKYMNAVARFANPWFMTEGNHECMGTGSNSGFCTASSQNANYLAFMNALTRSHPYYKVNITTSKGLATFVFVADNSWTSTQESWLKQTLTTADANATYTIVVKHHPSSSTSVSSNAAITRIINQHKHTLLLTGHVHQYAHPHPREIVLGVGGAHLTSASAQFGYAMVDQKTDGDLKVTVYSLATGAAIDTWTVTPQ